MRGGVVLIEWWEKGLSMNSLETVKIGDLPHFEATYYRILEHSCGLHTYFNGSVLEKWGKFTFFKYN